MSQDNNETVLDESFGEFQGAPQEVTCWGCREGILNQLGHMDYGGCLYFEEPYQDDHVIETMSKTETEDDQAVCEAILTEILEELTEH